MKSKLLLLLIIAAAVAGLAYWLKSTPEGEAFRRSTFPDDRPLTSDPGPVRPIPEPAPSPTPFPNLPDEAASAPTPAPAAGITLVKDGAPAATIVTAAEPTAAAAFAVRELNEHTRKITGAELPVVTDVAEVTGPRILVGESGATRKLGLKSADFASQEYAVKFNPPGAEDTVVLIGRDREGRRADQPKWAEGKWNFGMAFDRNQFLYIPESGFDDKAGTIEVCVYLPKEGFVDDGTIVRLQGRDNNGLVPMSYYLLSTLSNNSVAFSAKAPAGQRALVATPPLGEGWHYIKATHSAADKKIELFADGQSCGTSPYTPAALAGAAMAVGAVTPHHWAERASVSNGLRGRIDGLRVSDVVRPADDSWKSGPLVADEHTTLLVNFDEGKGTPADTSAHRRIVAPPWYFEDRGTLDATYDFLEKSCGVRWYLPGDIGTITPKSTTLAVSGADIRRKPAMDYRWMVWSPLYIPGPPAAAIPDSDATLWKLRMRLGGNPYQANHSFTGYYGDYLKQHPDWFAQGYQGRPPQPCFSSDGLLEQVVRDVNDYFDGKGLKPLAMGMGDYFGVVPQDSESWCKCPKCQAQLDPRYDEKYPLWMNGRASNYVFGFVNKVAKEVGKTHPDKFIAALAYSKYGYLPEGIALEPNIAVQLCLQPRNWYGPAMRDNDIKTLDAWAPEAAKRPFYLWLYYCFPALQTWMQKWQFFPGFFAHTVVGQMERYHKAGVRGIFLEHSSEYGQTFLMDQVELYVTFKLANDPTLDGNKLIDELFSAYYGAAAPAMRELYDAIEETYMTTANYPEEVQNKPGQWHQTEKIAWGYLGTPERMKHFGELMERAKKEADTKQTWQRVALFEEGLWKPMQAGAAAWAKKSGGAGDREKLAAQPPPTMEVPAVANAGGDPAKVDWTKAAEAPGDWFTIMGDPSQQKLKAWLAHDGAFLYIKVEQLRDATGLVSKDEIWGGDDWEIFFSPSRTAPPRQFMINPAGKTASADLGRTDGKWDSGAIGISDRSHTFAWRATFAFPLKSLVEGGAKPGTPVFTNIYRSNAGANEFFALSPNFEMNFRTSKRMVELKLK